MSEEFSQKTPTSRLILIIVLVVVLFALGIYIGFYMGVNSVSNELVVAEIQTTPTTSASTITTSSPTSSSIDTSDWKTYTNDDYGFTLKFTDKWKGYIVEKTNNNNSALATFRIYVPTNDQIFYEKEKPGYAMPFIIDIYKKTTYDTLKNQNEPAFNMEYGNFLLDNGNYVATDSTWQATPEDLYNSGLSDEVMSVVKSFQFTK
jgi:hypothetical protein